MRATCTITGCTSRIYKGKCVAHDIRSHGCASYAVHVSTIRGRDNYRCDICGHRFATREGDGPWAPRRR